MSLARGWLGAPGRSDRAKLRALCLLFIPGFKVFLRVPGAKGFYIGEPGVK